MAMNAIFPVMQNDLYSIEPTESKKSKWKNTEKKSKFSKTIWLLIRRDTIIFAHKILVILLSASLNILINEITYGEKKWISSKVWSVVIINTTALTVQNSASIQLHHEWMTKSLEIGVWLKHFFRGSSFMHPQCLIVFFFPNIFFLVW